MEKEFFTIALKVAKGDVNLDFYKLEDIYNCIYPTWDVVSVEEKTKRIEQLIDIYKSSSEETWAFIEGICHDLYKAKGGRFYEDVYKGKLCTLENLAFRLMKIDKVYNSQIRDELMKVLQIEDWVTYLIENGYPLTTEKEIECAVGYAEAAGLYGGEANLIRKTLYDGGILNEDQKDTILGHIHVCIRENH